MDIFCINLDKAIGKTSFKSIFRGVEAHGGIFRLHKGFSIWTQAQTQYSPIFTVYRVQRIACLCLLIIPESAQDHFTRTELCSYCN